MKFFRWLPGRQGTGYRKMLLAQGRAWDLYVIDYPPGTGVPSHVDEVPGSRHYRVNVTLCGNPRRFGVFDVCGNWPECGCVREWLGGRISFFRPDRVVHYVTEAAARRVVLSIGWTRRQGDN